MYLYKRRQGKAGQKNLEYHQGANQTLDKPGFRPNLATYQNTETETIEHIFFATEEFNRGHQHNAIYPNSSQYPNTETNNPTLYSYATLGDSHAYDLHN